MDHQQRGLGLVGLLMLLGLAAGAYWCYLVGPLFLHDVEVKQAARGQLRNLLLGNTTEERAREDFLVEAAKQGVSLSEDNAHLEISPDNDWAEFQVAYNAPYKSAFSERWRYWAFRWTIRETK